MHQIFELIPSCILHSGLFAFSGDIEDLRWYRGVVGEILVTRYLKQNGYTILYRNWRRKYLEIDIVARFGEELVFVEVKTRNKKHLQTSILEDTFGRKKRERTFRAVQEFLFSHRSKMRRMRICRYRVDLVGVVFASSDSSFVHYRNLKQHW